MHRFLFHMYQQIPDATGILSAIFILARVSLASATREGYTQTAAVVILPSFSSKPRANSRSDDNGRTACK